ncbi:ABC transporter ATP-binding protein [Microbacterium sp.]|uniref:ABC transporter ATP-binding protein n=1 Tax=Microbacterium sp. TaxID=51671 RepID=UPI003A8D08BA
MSLLAVRNATVAFGGVLAVNDVSLQVDRGEIVGLVGPNGAGKSTLFGAIAGAVTLRDGSIELDGARLSGCPPHRIARMGVARTFQKVRLFGSMSVEENVMVAAGEHFGGRAARAATAAALETVHYAGDARTPVAGLPLSDRKRVEIARALAAGPQLLLLDEMMNGLTVDETNALLASIKTLPQAGVTVMLVEHVLHVVRSLCDRLVVLHHGRLIAEGKPADVLTRDEVVAAWLGGAAEQGRA